MSLYCQVWSDRARNLGWWRCCGGVPDSLPLCSSIVLGSHPFSFEQPLVHEGQSSGSGSSFSCGEGGSRASPPSLSSLLQPVVSSEEDLRVVEAGHQPFHSEPSHPQVSVQDGDSPVCASVGAERRLVSLDLKDTYLQVPIHPDSRKYLRFVAFGRVYQFKTVFWSLHGSASLHEGHGSGIDFSSSCWDQNSSVFRRLSDPGSLSFFGSSSSGHNAAIVSGLGDCSELGEVESSSFPAHRISGGGSGFAVFQGFSLPAESGEALVNRRRIFVLHHAASVILARALRSPVISDSSDSRWLPPLAVAPAASPSLVGSSRRFDLSLVGLLLLTGSGVVAGAVASGVRHLSCADIPRPQL